MVGMLGHRLQIKEKRTRVTDHVRSHIHSIVQVAIELCFRDRDQCVRIGVQELLLFVFVQSGIGDRIGVIGVTA